MAERHQPLYLKRRPEKLSALIGQPAVQRTLINALEYKRLSHAYLFTGPRGCGKTSSARILAKSLNCESGPTADPCLKCAPCEEIKEGRSPAVFEIDAASHNSVDDARTLIERAPLVAVGGRMKVYIIDECHMLTKEAFNALLKTIEEPPADVTFILATTEEHKVPPTILSRCQRLMFRLVGQDELASYLRRIADEEKIEIEDEALRVIARRSGGGLRDAIGLLDQASLLSAPGKPVGVNDLLSLLGAVHEDVLIDMSAHVLDKNGGAVLAAVNKLIAEGREAAVIATEVARHFLNLTKASYLAADASADAETIRSMIVGSPEYVSSLCEQAPKFDRVELAQMVEHLDRLEQACRRTTQPAMAIEMGLVALCHRHDIHLVRELAEKVSKLEAALQNGGFDPSAVRTSAPPAVAKVPNVVHAPPPSPSKSVVSPAPQESLPQPDKPAMTSAPSAATPSVAPQSAPPPPVKRPPEPAAITAHADESEDVDLDEFRDRLVDELNRLNKISIRSIIEQHCIIQNISKNEVTIGVPNALFQDNIERRADQLKKICDNLLGRPVQIRARIFETVTLPAERQRATQSAPSARTSEPGDDDPDDGNDNPERAGRPRSQGGEPAPVASRAPLSRAENSEPPEPVASAPSQSQPQPSQSSPAVSSDLTDDPDGSGLMKEAYKLFEGPGSRQIG